MKHRYRVPGRVELVGKHVDYAGGVSVTCATPVAMSALSTLRTKRIVRVQDLRSKRHAQVPLKADARAGKDKWTLYVAAAARRVARDFPEAKVGVDVRLRSGIPSSAGLSSSSALVTTLVLALFDANGLWDDPRWQALAADPLAFPQYCAAVESGAPFGPFAGDAGVGTRGGAQDHIAICASQAGFVGAYGYLPGRIVERVAWPAEWKLVVQHSGVKATKTGNARGAYNRVADSVRTLVAAWNADQRRDDPTLAAALASGDGAADALRSLAAQSTQRDYDAKWLRGRLDQYIHEVSWVVPEFLRGLSSADTATVAAAMEASQRGAVTGLTNQVPETIWLAEQAARYGAVAATAFGAGFGGAVWALVVGDAVEFATAWQREYRRAFPSAPRPVSPIIMSPSAGMAREG